MSDLIPLAEWKMELKSADAYEQQPVVFDGIQKVGFSLPSGWNVGLAVKHDQDLTNASVTVDGEEYFLTKEAVTRVCVEIGLTARYIEKTPGALIESHLNYWATHAPETTFGLLIRDNIAAAVVKKGLITWPNIEILEFVLEPMVEWFATDSDAYVKVDTKSHHDLDLTCTRVVATGEYDSGWSPGLQVTNSLTGRHVVGVEGFLRHDDGLGIVTQHAAAHYNRRAGNNLSDVGEWMPDAVTGVLDAYEFEVETLTEIAAQAPGAMDKVLAGVFRTYKVPLKVRNLIIDAVTKGGDASFYGIVAAIATVAEIPELPHSTVTALMQVAGALAHDSGHLCTECQQVIA